MRCLTQPSDSTSARGADSVGCSAPPVSLAAPPPTAPQKIHGRSTALRMVRQGIQPQWHVTRVKRRVGHEKFRQARAKRHQLVRAPVLAIVGTQQALTGTRNKARSAEHIQQSHDSTPTCRGMQKEESARRLAPSPPVIQLGVRGSLGGEGAAGEKSETRQACAGRVSKILEVGQFRRFTFCRSCSGCRCWHLRHTTRCRGVDGEKYRQATKQM